MVVATSHIYAVHSLHVAASAPRGLIELVHSVSLRWVAVTFVIEGVMRQRKSEVLAIHNLRLHCSTAPVDVGLYPVLGWSSDAT